MVVCVLASHDFKLEVDAVNAATGFDYTVQEALDELTETANEILAEQMEGM